MITREDEFTNDHSDPGPIVAGQFAEYVQVIQPQSVPASKNEIGTTKSRFGYLYCKNDLREVQAMLEAMKHVLKIPVLSYSVVYHICGTSLERRQRQ